MVKISVLTNISLLWHLFTEIDKANREYAELVLQLQVAHCCDHMVLGSGHVTDYRKA